MTSWTKSGLFNAVCVKACPAAGGSVKSKGSCVQKSTDAEKDGKVGVAGTDFNIVANDKENKAIVSQDTCG